MSSAIKPIFLFADSQLLFWQQDGVLFLHSVRDLIETDEPRAAYIGASNDDNPDFYSIFVAAMENIGIKMCRMIPSIFTSEDENFLLAADMILLAGGDALKGWRAFEANGLRDLIVERYMNGALLIGVSAGAMQLGLYVWPETGPSMNSLSSAFSLLPFIISPHDEKQEWHQLRKALQMGKTNFSGIGIPGGGGMIYHTDHSIEPIRFPLHEFSLDDDKIKASLLYPKGDEEIDEAPYVC